MLDQQQHVPVFVGSTFIDLRTYREAVQNALHRLEAIVRGMEYFGSDPADPVSVCLAAVRSCKVYIGIFGMRYGSIPNGYEHSMTHLEYEEAQKATLPSLIYIIDEERQPILPKHVDTGDAAEKLRKLKTHLRQKHTVSFFTTESDLAGRVLADLPRELKKIGTKVDGVIETTENLHSAETLRLFDGVPRRHTGKEVVVEFLCGAEFQEASDACCKALKLSMGDAVAGPQRVVGGKTWLILAENTIAEQLLSTSKGAKIKARAITAYGLLPSGGSDSNGAQSQQSFKGLIVKHIFQNENQSAPKQHNPRWQI